MKKSTNTAERKHYIDNLRWLILLILIPYHAAMAHNVWGEPNYISLDGSRTLSSIVVFFSPFFMPLLFALAGISTRFSLEKRTFGEYIGERAKRLLIPFVFGTLVFMPVMTYLADRFNCGHEGGFIAHYAVFFTKFTDLTGADGGFSVGQFWFLLYLFVISVICAGIIILIEKRGVKADRSLPFTAVILLGLPLPLVCGWLSVGGKSLAEYAYFFMLGYYVFADDKAAEKAEKYRFALTGTGLVASAADVYMFIWSGRDFGALNDAAKYLAEWFMILGLLGMSKAYLDRTGKAFEYMKARSFPYYICHYIWVVLFQYLLYPVMGDNTALFYIMTVVLSCICAFACCEVIVRVPLLCMLAGMKYSRK